jgi:hypothetical protein
MSIVEQNTFAADVRTTEDGRKSVFDLLDRQGVTNAGRTWKRLCERYPEVVASCRYWKFPGAGQRETPVVDSAGWEKIESLLGQYYCRAEKKTSQQVFVYVIGDKKRKVCKIGISRDVKKRLGTIQVGYPWPLAIWAFVPYTNAEVIEKRLHLRFADFRLNGEWFHSSVFEMIEWSALGD